MAGSASARVAKAGSPDAGTITNSASPCSSGYLCGTRPASIHFTKAAFEPSGSATMWAVASTTRSSSCWSVDCNVDATLAEVWAKARFPLSTAPAAVSRAASRVPANPRATTAAATTAHTRTNVDHDGRGSPAPDPLLVCDRIVCLVPRPCNARGGVRPGSLNGVIGPIPRELEESGETPARQNVHKRCEPDSDPGVFLS